MTCDNCGACCSQQGTPPFGLDFDDLPDDLKWDRWAHANRYDLGLPCLWYDAETRRCQHYDHRPLACREFVAGELDCNDMRIQIGLERL